MSTNNCRNYLIPMVMESMKECCPNNFSSSDFFWLLVVDICDMAKEVGKWYVEISLVVNLGLPFAKVKNILKLGLSQTVHQDPSPNWKTVF